MFILRKLVTLLGGEGESLAVSPLRRRRFNIPALGEASGGGLLAT